MKLAMLNQESMKLLQRCERHESLFQLSDYTSKRLKNGIFEINNIVYNEYIILPFIFDVNWKSEIGNLSGLKTKRKYH